MFSTRACVSDQAAIYVPYTLKMYMFTQILIRTRIPPPLLRDLRAQSFTWTPTSRSPTPRSRNLDRQRKTEYGQQRFVRHAVRSFLDLALVWPPSDSTASFPYGVATRTNEFRHSMALGAKAADVSAWCSLTAMSWHGLAAGLILSIAFNKLLHQVGQRELPRSTNLGRRNP